MKKLLNILVILSVILMSVFLASFIASAIEKPPAFIPLVIVLIFFGILSRHSTRGVLSLALNAKDILFTQGQFNPGGGDEFISYAFEEDVESWPAAITDIDTAAAATFNELVVIPDDDPFVMKSGKYFYKLYCTQEEGEVKTTMIGPVDSRAWQNEAEISYPGNEEEMLGYLGAAANRKLVVIFHEANGKSRVIGFPRFAARLEKAEGSSGKKVEDGRKTVMSFLAKGAVPAPIYQADIPYEPESE